MRRASPCRRASTCATPTGRYLFVAGQSTRQRAVYKGTQPVCGDWFYTDGSFSIEVGPGEAQIDIAHGPAYATAHEAIPIVAGQTIEKTYTLRRLIDPLAMGWYSADEHLHQMPDSCADAGRRPEPGRHSHLRRRGAELPPAPEGRRNCPMPHHLLVTELPALEWDCFLWNLPKPLEMRLGKDPWPQEDFATSDRPGGSADLRTSFVVRTPFLVEQMHAAGATTIAYMHDPPRIWYYPLYVANGWIDVYGVLENGYCGIANRGTEADFWQSLDREGTNGNFGVWYRFLNCGYRLPASAGTDNIGMGVGVWKGYNRVYAKLDGPLTVENWLAALKRGRTFVTNRPLLFVTVDGKEPGSELAVKSAQAAPECGHPCRLGHAHLPHRYLAPRPRAEADRRGSACRGHPPQREDHRAQERMAGGAVSGARREPQPLARLCLRAHQPLLRAGGRPADPLAGRCPLFPRPVLRVREAVAAPGEERADPPHPRVQVPRRPGQVRGTSGVHSMIRVLGLPFLATALAAAAPAATFDVKSAGTGPIRIARDYPHTFQYQSGERFFPMGDTAYFLIAQPKDVIVHYIDTRRAHKFNFVRMMPMARGHWAFGGTPGKPDYTVINETAMRKLDWVFDYAATKGMNIELIIFGYGVEQGEGLWANATDQNFWVDSLVKRYKDRPNLFMWTVANEFERYPDGRYSYSAEDVEWVKAVAVQIRRTDTAHPIGAHPSVWITKDDPFQKYGNFTQRRPQVVWPLWENSRIDLNVTQNNEGVQRRTWGNFTPTQRGLTYYPTDWEGVSYPVRWTDKWVGLRSGRDGRLHCRGLGTRQTGPEHGIRLSS